MTAKSRTRVGALLLVAGLLALAGCSTPNDRTNQGGQASASTAPTSSATGSGPTTTVTAPATGEPTPSASSSPKSTSPARVQYTFPVRSAQARYGAYHHDYPAADIFAPCGSPAVATTAGRVDQVSRTDTWSPATNRGPVRGGLSVAIVGADGVRYYGSHLRSIAAGIKPGAAVRAGQELGRVGNTGDARGIACHLHYGISPVCRAGDWWIRRGVVKPYRFLRAWQRGTDLSPVQVVRDWRASGGCKTKPPTGQEAS